MKVTRKMLLIITASLGVLIIVYSLVREFTGFGLHETMEKYLFEVIVIAALGLFMYNRKMACDERLAKEAAEEAERRAAEESEEAISPEDENLPHWERHKTSVNKETAKEGEDEEEENEDAEED